MHLHQLLGLLVLLVVGAVSGPSGLEDLGVESLCGELLGELGVLDELPFLGIILVLHDGDGLLPLLQQGRRLILLHVPDGLVGLVPQILGLLEFEGLVVPEEVYFVIEFVLPDALDLVERPGLVFGGLEFVVCVLDPLLHEYVDVLEALLHELEAVGLVADVLEVLLALVEQLVAVDPGLLRHLLVEDDLLPHLRNHRVRVFDLVLRPLVLLEVLVQLGLQLGQVALLLLGRGVDGAHGFERDLGEGAAIAGLVDVVVEDAHLAAVGKVGLDLALDGGLAVDDLQVLDMRLVAPVAGGLRLVLDRLLLGLVQRPLSLRGLPGEEVVVFVEVDLDLRKRGGFC